MTDSQDIANWSLTQLGRAIEKAELSPVELTHRMLERIHAADAQLNAFITVADDDALASASCLEKELVKHGARGPLHGIPIAIKDVIYTRGLRTTMGADTYREYVPDFDAGLVERLKDAGAIIVGKLNTHQFAYGPTGDRSYFGPVRNPHDPRKISGGSSSGSGAAVAARLCVAAIGTDTGGSVRIPASCCGIVGMKPTFGRISKHGVYPLSWSLDHPGPMTRTVKDNALLMGVLAGHDARDPYSVHRSSEDFTRYLGGDLKGKVVGVPTAFYFEHIDAEVEASVRGAINIFRGLGATVRDIELPNVQKVLEAQRTVLAAEAFAIHYRLLQDAPNQYDEEVRERLLAGEPIPARDYIAAQQLRYAAISELKQVFSQVDVLAAPTLPVLPTDLDQRRVAIQDSEELVRSALTRLTGPTNLTGFPSLSVPCGFSSGGLPIGLQLIGESFNEAGLYQFGHALETATGGSTDSIER